MNLNLQLSEPRAIFSAIGLGEDFRMTGRDTVGSALVAEDRIIHLAAFPVMLQRESRRRIDREA